MAVARFERSQLGALTKISEGGQGIVYDAPRLRINGVGEAVYKEYKPEALAQVDVRQLEAMVAFLGTLPSDRATRLVELAAWPLALVCDHGQVTGFAMPRVPAEFFVELQLPGGLKLALAQFQHLFNREDWLAQRNVAIHDRLRLELLADVADALDFLHSHGVAVGDFSAKNLLFSLSPTPRCYFIDCDAMTLGGHTVMKQFETPDWDVRAVSSEPLATPASDAYKLGLLAVRLFALDQTTRAYGYPMPGSLTKLAALALDKKPSRRPAPAAWRKPINSAMANASMALPQRGAAAPVASITVVPQEAAAALWGGQQAPITQPAPAIPNPAAAVASSVFPGLATMPTPVTPPPQTPPQPPAQPPQPPMRPAPTPTRPPTHQHPHGQPAKQPIVNPAAATLGQSIPPVTPMPVPQPPTSTPTHQVQPTHRHQPTHQPHQGAPASATVPVQPAGAPVTSFAGPHPGGGAGVRGSVGGVLGSSVAAPVAGGAGAAGPAAGAGGLVARRAAWRVARLARRQARGSRLAALRAGRLAGSVRAVGSTAGAVGSVVGEAVSFSVRWVATMVPASLVASLWAALSFERVGDYPPYGRALRHLIGITGVLTVPVVMAAVAFAICRRATGRRASLQPVPRWQARAMLSAGLVGLGLFLLGAYVEMPFFRWHHQPEMGPDAVAWWGTPALIAATFVITLPFRFREP